MATATKQPSVLTRERDPKYLSMYALRDTRAAHAPIICHTVSKGGKGDPNDKRRYQGICKFAGCDYGPNKTAWVGSVTTGSKALDEMEAHALATATAVAAATPDAENAPPVESGTQNGDAPVDVTGEAELEKELEELADEPADLADDLPDEEENPEEAAV